MKKSFLLILAFNSITCFSQKFDTYYTRAEKSTSCSEDKLSFHFTGEKLLLTDWYHNTVTEYISKLDGNGFDINGFYYENYTQMFYLEEYGSLYYDRIQKKTFRAVYDKKGGSLLYIISGDKYKIQLHLTYLGYEIMCR